MREKDIEAFLTHLAIDRKVASSTQNQAFNALIFLYKEVLNIELKDTINAIRAKNLKKFLQFNIGAGHAADDEMMEWADGVKVNRAGPVFIVNDGDNMKSLYAVFDRLDDSCEIRSQMSILRCFCNPIFFVLGMTKDKKCGILPRGHGYVFGK